ncbi:MAG: response regulator [Phycisphaerae bacterium]|nr:response regulator [Phycisphaerae bacterium]
MKSLIVEDDFAARRLMQIYLVAYGECSVAINGVEAVKAVQNAIEENEPYDLICLDIMMPIMDGMEALARIREIEKQNGIEGLDVAKIIMTTAKNLSSDVLGAFNAGCESYLVKPIRKISLLTELEKMDLLKPKYQV